MNYQIAALHHHLNRYAIIDGALRGYLVDSRDLFSLLLKTQRQISPTFQKGTANEVSQVIRELERVSLVPWRLLSEILPGAG